MSEMIEDRGDEAQVADNSCMVGLHAETYGETATPVSVMIVDDDPVMRRGLSRVVESDAGLRVVGDAANGEDAVELADQLKPQVVVMDIHLPIMDGIEATRRIKARYPSMIVIGASAYADEEKRCEMVRAGACVLLDKMSVDSNLTAVIGRCLLACGKRCHTTPPFGGYCSCEGGGLAANGTASRAQAPFFSQFKMAHSLCRVRATV